MARQRTQRSFNSIYEYRDYRQYVIDRLSSLPKSRGARTKVAKAMRVHNTFVSQVLGGRAHFSLEQAEELSRFLGHTEQESEFFLLLVGFSRAGSKGLRQYYEGKLDEAVRARSELKNRLRHEKVLIPEEQIVYYSAPEYAAIHMLLGIAEYQLESVVRISDRTKLSPKRTAEIIEFLIRTGMAKHEGPTIRISPTQMHLGRDAPMIARHHTNWRIEAIKSVVGETPQDLHYSTVVTIAKKDVQSIKKIFLNALEEIHGIARDSSPDEELLCYCVDLFKPFS